MKILLATCATALLLAPTAASAQICRAYEYAELKDMSKETLVEKYCEYQEDMYASLKADVANVTAGRRARSSGGNCAQEMERISRVLETKFGMAKNPSCKPTK